MVLLHVVVRILELSTIVKGMAHGKEQSHRKCSLAAVEELTCPRSPSSEYRNRKHNLRVLNANPVLYLLVLGQWLCPYGQLSSAGDLKAPPSLLL